MKVYVCYKSWDFEGCSEPLFIFSNEDKAKEWCENNKKSHYQDAEYVELEVE